MLVASLWRSSKASNYELESSSIGMMWSSGKWTDFLRFWWVADYFLRPLSGVSRPSENSSNRTFWEAAVLGLLRDLGFILADCSDSWSSLFLMRSSFWTFAWSPFWSSGLTSIFMGFLIWVIYLGWDYFCMPRPGLVSTFLFFNGLSALQLLRWIANLSGRKVLSQWGHDSRTFLSQSSSCSFRNSILFWEDTRDCCTSISRLGISFCCFSSGALTGISPWLDAWAKLLVALTS